MMRQKAIMAGAIALLAVLVSGCATGSVPAGKTASLASAEKAEPADTDGEDEGAASMLTAFAAPNTPVSAGKAPTSELDFLISKYASQYAVPERLVHRVIIRESKYNPSARNGSFFGLMQISHATASTMGYRGNSSGLLDAETNLRYAVKYLAGAYMVAHGNEDQAVRFYARGYYYDAKRQGLLEETGLR